MKEASVAELKAKPSEYLAAVSRGEFVIWRTSFLGESRVDLVHLLEDLRDAYPGSLAETILTEIIANALDPGASTLLLRTDPEHSTLIAIDDGKGTQPLPWFGHIQ